MLFVVFVGLVVLVVVCSAAGVVDVLLLLLLLLLLVMMLKLVVVLLLFLLLVVCRGGDVARVGVGLVITCSPCRHISRIARQRTEHTAAKPMVVEIDHL